MAAEDGGKATIEPFKHGSRYCYGARRPVYLDSRDPEADQEGILRSVGHKAFNPYSKYSAICGMPVAIREEHLRAGFPNPLKDKPLVYIAMVGPSERRRKTPAWWRASVAALEAEARQIEREAAWEVELGLELEAARPEAAAEFTAAPDREAVARTEDRTHALWSKAPVFMWRVSGTRCWDCMASLIESDVSRE